MQVGDQAYGGIYAGSVNGHHIICSPIEYDFPFRVTWLQAVDYCKSVGMELPTKEELNLLYELYKLRPDYFPKRQYQWYWASTESSTTYAWSQYFFLNGNQYTNSKTVHIYARPIKRIKV